MAGYLRERVAAARIADLEAAVTSQGKRVRDLEAALREIAAMPGKGLGGTGAAGWLLTLEAPEIARAVLAGETAGEPRGKNDGGEAEKQAWLRDNAEALPSSDQLKDGLRARTSPGRSER